MELDITKLPTYWITIESAVERHDKMNSMFETLGFENTIQLNGSLMNKEGKSFMEIQKEKGHLVAECHAKALVNSGPILVLEDDVWYTDDFDPIVEYKEDTDAIYLGTSVWGMVNGVSTGGGTRFQKLNESTVKPLNMLGVHSVLYISDDYKNKTMENMLGAKNNGMIMDEPVAIDMQNHNIICYSRPRFYQQDGHNDYVTTIPLEVSA
tara:strand:- start:158 stop:784 length:627 start_codon:yes stop_codon:yes gene_type:complete